MTRFAVVVGLLLGLAGCKKEQPPSPLPPEVQQAVKESGGQPAAAGAKVDCEKLVPAALREKYAPGSTLVQKPMCPGCPEECELTPKSKQESAPSVLADCRNTGPDWFEHTTKMAEQLQGTPVELGRFARTMNGMRLVFIPSKHDCYLTVTWFGGGDKLLPLAKEIEAGLTPAALGL